MHQSALPPWTCLATCTTQLHSDPHSYFFSHSYPPAAGMQVSILCAVSLWVFTFSWVGLKASVAMHIVTLVCTPHDIHSQLNSPFCEHGAMSSWQGWLISLLFSCVFQQVKKAPAAHCTCFVCDLQSKGAEHWPATRNLGKRPFTTDLPDLSVHQNHIRAWRGTCLRSMRNVNLDPALRPT